MARRRLSLATATAISLSLLAATGCHEAKTCVCRDEFGGVCPGTRVERRGDEIVAAGQLFHTGTRVVLWLDPKGYDAYNGHNHFAPASQPATKPARKRGSAVEETPDPNRYNERAGFSEDIMQRIAEEDWTLQNLQEVVDQFVIHFDVCGTSRQCFKVLHDVRHLSVQFMLDVDGTIYQTLDLKERAWQATKANSRSIGIEIAQIGAYGSMKTLDQWYAHDANGWPYITLPSWMSETGVRTPGFVGKPARKDVIKGRINGHDLMQYDFTNEQYEALIHLTAALGKVFPKIQLDAPRNADGTVKGDQLPDAEYQQWKGLLGHYHVQKEKTDPGPAFNWDRVINGAKALTCKETL